MPEENNQTPEEKREKRLQNLEEILGNKFHQDVIGFTTLKREPYQFGKFGNELGQADYSKLMNTEEAQEMYSKESEIEKKTLGISETASASYYIERKVRQMVRGEAFQELPLGRLEKAVKSVIPELEFEVAEDMRDISYMGLAMKQNENGELSDEEKYALEVHQYLLGAYENYLAVNQLKGGYVSQLNTQGKRLSKAYNQLRGIEEEQTEEAEAEEAEVVGQEE